jgi:hypothetical protein
VERKSSRLGVCHRVQLGASLGARLGVYSRMYSEVYLGAYSECTSERLESLLGSVSQAGWECAIESNWERIVKQAGSVQPSAIRSVLQSVDGSMQHAMKCSMLSSCMERDV